jgi:hypothetical protein
LPMFLERLFCGYNQFNYPFNIPHEEILLFEEVKYFNYFMLRHRIRIINKFRYLYYFIKIKKWLWEKIMEKIIEPKIMKKYHPSYLIKNLDKDTDLDMVLNNW